MQLMWVKCALQLLRSWDRLSHLIAGQSKLFMPFVHDVSTATYTLDDELSMLCFADCRAFPVLVMCTALSQCQKTSGLSMQESDLAGFRCHSCTKCCWPVTCMQCTCKDAVLFCQYINFCWQNCTFWNPIWLLPDGPALISTAYNPR